MNPSIEIIYFVMLKGSGEVDILLDFKDKVNLTNYSFCNFQKNSPPSKKNKLQNGLSGRVVEKSIV